MAFRTLASGLGIGRQAWLFPLDVTFKTIGLRYGWLKGLFDQAPAGPLAMTGRLRAERAAWRAVRDVPAYRDYVSSQNIDVRGLVPAGILSKLPESDKHSYIDRYPLAERCLHGRIPFLGTTIDESSGSTGAPYNWIRSQAERHIAHRNISFFARYCFGAGDLVTVNAFSMGAWATGFNMSLALNHNGIVKSTGPDTGKILSTMRFLGPGYRYLILGYPPFVKHLLDEGDADRMPWDQYRMHAMVGGEGMTEELRDHLLRRFESVYSGYGATDIEIGMAGESPASVAIRRIARAHPDLREALFGRDSRLPMVFQYNPLIHHLEVNGEREVVCTISRLDVLAPRIRYNVHDEGGLLDYGRMMATLRSFGLDSAEFGRDPAADGPRGPLPWVRPVRLPFLWIYGRRDATISVMGANIYPEDIESLIYRDQPLADRVHSFCLSVVTDASSTPRPCIALEMPDDRSIDPAWPRQVAAQFQEGLARLNLDYRAALSEFPAAMLPIVEAHPRGQGPFKGDVGRIKQRRIAER